MHWRFFEKEGIEDSSFSTQYQGYQYGSDVKNAIEDQLKALGFEGKLGEESALAPDEVLPGILGGLGNKPEFGDIRDHAARHGPELGRYSANSYYRHAVQHLETGTRFAFRHAGTQKTAYITRLGPDKFMFTSTTQSGERIFTHMAVNTQYLRNIGITLPKGF